MQTPLYLLLLEGLSPLHDERRMHIMDELQTAILLRILTKGFTMMEAKQINNHKLLEEAKWLYYHQKDFPSREEARAYYASCDDMYK